VAIYYHNVGSATVPTLNSGHGGPPYSIFDLGIAILRKIKEIEELRGGVLLVRRTSDSED
jgi:hypothetical protein